MGNAAFVASLSQCVLTVTGQNNSDSEIAGFDNIAYIENFNSDNLIGRNLTVEHSSAQCWIANRHRQPTLAGHGALHGVSLLGSCAPSGSTHFNSTSTPNAREIQSPWARPYLWTAILPDCDHTTDNYCDFQSNMSREFPREKLHIQHQIGEGSFGDVWIAEASGVLGQRGRQVVAVKMIKGL